MICSEFKEPRNKGTEFYKDSCLKCGMPEDYHMQVVIYYQDKILRFKSWEEAHKKGFYPG